MKNTAVKRLVTTRELNVVQDALVRDQEGGGISIHKTTETTRTGDTGGESNKILVRLKFFDRICHLVAIGGQREDPIDEVLDDPDIAVYGKRQCF